MIQLTLLIFLFEKDDFRRYFSSFQILCWLKKRSGNRALSSFVGRVAATAKRMLHSTGIQVLTAFPTPHAPEHCLQTVQGACRMALTSPAHGQYCTQDTVSPYKLCLPSWTGRTRRVGTASRIHPCLACTKHSSMSVPYLRIKECIFKSLKGYTERQQGKQSPSDPVDFWVNHIFQLTFPSCYTDLLVLFVIIIYSFNNVGFFFLT